MYFKTDAMHQSIYASIFILTAKNRFYLLLGLRLSVLLDVVKAVRGFTPETSSTSLKNGVYLINI